jgi:hypothetical protein
MPIHWNFQRTRKTLQIVAVMAISAIATLTIIMRSEGTKNKKNVVFNIADSTEKAKLVKAAKSAFSVYEKYCSNFDEVRPKTRECTNYYGFYATAVESLETFYLLGMKEQFNKAKKIVVKKLLPKEIGWVNRQEFWSRCIGSLIGTYILSGEHIFLERAAMFADKLINLQGRFPRFPTFVNFKLNKKEGTPWKNESISLSDITVGLPELFTLYNLTGVVKYLSAANQIISSVPEERSARKQFVNDITLKEIDFDRGLYEMDGHTIDMYNSLANSYLLTKNKIIFKKIKSLKKNFNNPGNVLTSSDVIETVRLMGKINVPITISSFKNDVINAYSDFQNLFKNHSRRTIQGFNFESQPLRAMLFTGKLDEFAKGYMESFDQFKCGDGYCGKMQTSSGRWISSGIQNSAFLGEWLKLGAEYLLIDEQDIKEGVVNSRGHFLKLGEE